LAGGALGPRYRTYCAFLEGLFDELALDLGILFDRHTPQSRVFPAERALEDVLLLLQNAELADLWVEDETIGWIYQYYNDPTERKKMRESAAPRNSYELAVRNQFFTPRYVVEFLTDNTLGRIWYEMMRGETQLADHCRYLVRRPAEIFLGDVEAAAERLGIEFDADHVPETVKAAYRGDFINSVSEENGADRAWIALAIPPGEFVKITGEPVTQLADYPHLDRVWRAVDYKADDPTLKEPAQILVALCQFVLTSSGGPYASAPMQRLWDALRAALEAQRESEPSQEKLLRQPVFIPYRAKKDPREILMLDPAGGSGHFGLYSFDLYEVIYREAYDDPDVGKKLREDYPDRGAFLREVPRLILAHNIHIIDIDPRACQIAGLALWLRAQRCYQQMGLQASERPQIRKVNVVCAEPMPGEQDMLEEFAAGLEPKELGELVRFVFERMKLAGEAGSLLRIEEELREKIADMRRRVGPLFAQGDFWKNAEEHVLAALHHYADKATNGGSTRRRLFADDTTRGFAFIDLCRKRYDVTLMNPPFGEPAVASCTYVNRRYPHAFIDVLAAFVERASDLSKGGRIGVLTSRACLYTKTLAQWRRKSFLPAVEALADLGGGVLDGAMVFACASVLATPASGSKVCVAVDLRKSVSRHSELLDAIEDIRETRPGRGVYFRDRNRLNQINSARFLYNTPDAFWEWSRSGKTLMSSGGSTRAGSTTYDDYRFLRLVWEVPADALGWSERWVLFSKGGYFETFYNDIHLVINWLDDGREVGEFNRIGYDTDAQSRRASSFYKRPGITYPRRTVKGFSPRALPEGCIFADKGPVVFSPDGPDLGFTLGYLNSSPIRALVHLQVQAGSFETGIVNTIPWLDDQTITRDIAKMALEAWRGKAIVYRTWEVDREFVPPCLGHLPSIAHFVTATINELQQNSDQIMKLCTEISIMVSAFFALPDIDLETFEVSPEDHRIQDDFGICEPGAGAIYVLQLALGCIFGRWDVRFAIGEKPAPALPDPFAALPLCPPGMLQTSAGNPMDPTRIPASYPLRILGSGIMVDDEENSEDVERCVREVLRAIWPDRVDAIEAEACSMLGVHSLRDYFRRTTGFFADHLRRYSKSRRQAPIYWPLSTASGRYTVWLYYHRLTQDTLYAVVVQYVTPKIASVQDQIDRLSDRLRRTTGKAANDLRDEIANLRSFLAELSDFRAELLRVAALPYKPDLNDGVIINAAPLHTLFRLRKWADDTTAVWKKLEAGEYDWSHMAYTIWPDRVREVCETDRSIAIAHGLEHLCKVEARQSKRKPRKPVESEVEDESEE